MANIVNGAKPVDRKKELYNKVGFSDLYSYNGTVDNLFAISQKFFGTIITEAVTGFRNPRSSDEQDGFVEWDLELRKQVADDADTPEKVYFSRIPIVDPVDGGAVTEDEINRLNDYITLGLYPIISMPSTFSGLITNYEKYDNSDEGSMQIGSIVYLLENSLGGRDAVVLWDPYFTKTSDPSVFRAYHGFLTVNGFISTPDCWKNPDAMAKTDVGVPVYKYTPFPGIINTINNVPNMSEYLNEAVVTGFLKLGFVDNLMAMNTAAVKAKAEEVQRSIAKNQEPEEIDSSESTVPVEDAKETDDFGHRLRLYDSDYPIYPDSAYIESAADEIEIDP